MNTFQATTAISVLLFSAPLLSGIHPIHPRQTECGANSNAGGGTGPLVEKNAYEASGNKELLGAPPASRAIGETTLALGDHAFAYRAECVAASGCPLDIGFNGGPPLFPFLGTTGGLTFEYTLGSIVADMNDEHDWRLDYPVPIVNEPGPDLYLAQAEFVGELGLFDTEGIQDFSLHFDNAPGWHTVPATQFVEDQAFGPHTVYWTDGGPLESDAYYLWYAVIDLTDYGYAPGESLTGLNVRGPAVPDWPDTVGLDVVTVASLNATFPGDWEYLGNGLKGTEGVPLLVGAGAAQGGSLNTLDLTHALPNANAFLIGGTRRIDQGFHGGTLVPEPRKVIRNLSIDSQGMLSFSFQWPSGRPPGFEVFVQVWVPDSRYSNGWAASNALSKVQL